MTKAQYIQEIKRNLLGGLEVALFMPVARKRFGTTKDEAMRSFIVPILFMPLTVIALCFYSNAALPQSSVHIVAALYSFRLVFMWGLFFSIVYWITKEVEKKEHFYQFVIATNWLTVPATAIFIPVAYMLITGMYQWSELYPFTMCLVMYSYAFTGFMAAYILRIPWELAGFIVFLGICVDNTSYEMFYWIGAQL